MNDHEIEALFPFYALGVLTEEERAQVEAYAAAHASARTRLNEWVQTAQTLPYDTTPVAPPESLRASLMARVRADAQAQQKEGVVAPTRQDARSWVQIIRSWLVSPAFSAASFAAFMLLSLWIVNLRTRIGYLETENQTLQKTLAALVEENNVLREEKKAQDVIIALLRESEKREFVLDGTEHQPEALGTFLVSAAEGREAILLVSNLPALPTGSAYQFWLIGEAGPVGAGLFQANDQAQGYLIVHSDQPVLSYEAIGVSIEPAGGSQQPTGNIVLYGTLN